MTMKSALLCAALGITASIAPGISFARAYVDIDIAPPAPREEIVPGPRVGYVWAPGYWDWDGHHHAWRKGHWEHERHGHHWVNDSWEQRGSRWHHERGHWD